MTLHKQVKYRDFEVDEELLSTIKALNEAGIETLYSCCGLDEDNDKDKPVEEEKPKKKRAPRKSKEKTENNNEPNKFDLAKAAIHKAILNSKSISEKEREETNKDLEELYKKMGSEKEEK